MQLQYAELLLSAGRPREAETRLERDPRDESGLARGDARARVPRDDGAAARRRERDTSASCAASNVSQRSVLLSRPHRGDGARLPASHALVRARDRRHARRRSAAAHGAHHVRGAERPRRRGAPPARLRRREPAVRDRTCSSRRASYCSRCSSPTRRCSCSTRRSRRRPTTRRCTPRTRSSTCCSRKAPSSAARSTKPRALLGEGLDRYPDDGSLRYSLALLYEDQGRNRKAARRARVARRRQPRRRRALERATAIC